MRPSFGPNTEKHDAIKRYTTSSGVGEKSNKNLHKMTKWHCSERGLSSFKTGALNHSATLPNQ